MNNYQDKYTRWHDKPCFNGEPSSNNGWIYTAYSKYLAPEQRSFEQNIACYNQCVRSYTPLRFDRSPGQITPPLSKDEVIGAVSLGFLNDKELAFNHWNFCNLDNFKPEKLTLRSAFKAAKLLYKIRKEHRNHMWENSLTDAYPLAFYLPPELQFYVLRYFGKSAGILRTIIFYINAALTIYKGDKSSRMMLWLMCKDLNLKFLLKFIDEKKYVEDYFQEGHPFRG